MALPSLLVADHQRLQLRVAAVKAAGRDVELPSQPAVPAAPERPAGAALQGPPPPNARALCARPWHRPALLKPSREPVPLAFIVSASRGLWKKCAPQHPTTHPMIHPMIHPTTRPGRAVCADHAAACQ